MGFNNEFGASGLLFSIVPMFIGIIFVFLIGSMLVRLFSFGQQKTKPKETVGARIVTKRQHVWGSHNATGTGGSDTTYYATFEMEDGNRVEYMVPENRIGLLVEGDIGTLTHQGTLFVEFNRVSDENGYEY